MASYKNIILQKKGKTAILTINREDKLNAVNRSTFLEISQAFDQMGTDDAIAGVIITGQGDKSFVAGADIQEFNGISSDEAFEMCSWVQQQVMDKIEAFGKPVVAAINGYALGGGLELAMACHIRLAVRQAKMGLPEVSLGLIPGYGGTQRLTYLVGRAKALEMILSADMIDAEQAERCGLVNYVMDSREALIEKALDILDRIYLRSSIAVSHAIRAVNMSALGSTEQGYDAEKSLFSACFKTEDLKEGIDAFINKRKPNFRGR